MSSHSSLGDAFRSSSSPHDLVRFDRAAAVADWLPIDDAVMGGESRSRLRYQVEGWAVFEGVLSLKHNGGFASVRSRPANFGSSGIGAYVLEVRGDGRRYRLSLRTDDAFDGLSYQGGFDAPAGAWTRVRIPLTEFLPTLRGRTVPGSPSLDPASVRQLGLMLADRQAGPFSLAIRFIAAE